MKTPPHDPASEELKALLEGALGAPVPSLKKLQGDASYRVYYRAVLPSKNLIVMKMPAGPASASEEITNLEEKPVEPPFLCVGRFLASRGLPVPRIFHYDAANGLIVLEDFGDETFERRIASLPGTDWEDWYRKAIDLLIDFQVKTALPGDCIAYRRSFDATLLDWEFDHFLEYGIEARLGAPIAEADRREIGLGTRAITRRLVSLPQILVHRDFQSRNIMIQGESLKLLDFQDALMGPLSYDLVALLRDSYIALTADLLDRLVGYYVSEARRKSVLSVDEAAFREAFNLMTIQRKLKDAGRFVYIDRVKGNPSFLKHIPNSLSYAREAFGRSPEQGALYGVLKRYVPEFRS